MALNLLYNQSRPWTWHLASWVSGSTCFLPTKMKLTSEGLRFKEEQRQAELEEGCVGDLDMWKVTLDWESKLQEPCGVHLAWNLCSILTDFLLWRLPCGPQHFKLPFSWTFVHFASSFWGTPHSTTQGSPAILLECLGKKSMVHMLALGHHQTSSVWSCLIYVSLAPNSALLS